MPTKGCGRLRTPPLTHCKSAAALRVCLSQALLDSRVLLALAPCLLGRLELHVRLRDAPEPGDRSTPREVLPQVLDAACFSQRLGAQLAQCSGLQELSINGIPFEHSLHLATELLLAPGLQRLRQLAVITPHTTRTPYYWGEDSGRQSAATAVLAAALTARHGRLPDAAAMGLRVATNMLLEQGAEDVMRALDAVGVRGVQVVASDD